MAETQKPGVMLYVDILPCLKRLSRAQKGELFEGILKYAKDGTEPELLNTAVGVAWDFIKQRIDRDTEAYENKVEKARAAVNKRWAASGKSDPEEAQNAPENGEKIRDDTQGYEAIPNIPTTTTTSTTSTTTASTTTDGVIARGAHTTADEGEEANVGKAKPKTKRFVPPTLEEVTEFVRSRNSPVDPQEFIDFYASKGWVIGKAPMKDWRAACRNAESWERWKNRPPKRETFPGEEELDPYDVIGLLRARGELYE